MIVTMVFTFSLSQTTSRVAFYSSTFVSYKLSRLDNVIGPGDISESRHIIAWFISVFTGYMVFCNAYYMICIAHFHLLYLKELLINDIYVIIYYVSLFNCARYNFHYLCSIKNAKTQAVY